MSSPGPLLRPYDKLIKIELLGREFDVPENNTVLRAMQYIAPERVSCGRFCWNEECQYCRIEFDRGEGTPTKIALGCKQIVEDGMRVTAFSLELRYCMREVLEAQPQQVQSRQDQPLNWFEQPS